MVYSVRVPPKPLVENFELYKKTIVKEYMPNITDEYNDYGKEFKCIIDEIIYRDWWNKTGFNYGVKMHFLKTINESINLMLAEEPFYEISP